MDQRLTYNSQLEEYQFHPGGAVSNTSGTSYFTYSNYPTYEPLPLYQYTWPNVNITHSEPTDCIGKAHVFECDHVEECKCGKIKRVLAKKK